MSMLINLVKSFARNEEGQDLLEYTLLVALIALVAIGAVTARPAQTVSTIFNDIAASLDAGVVVAWRIGWAGASTRRPASSRRAEDAGGCQERVDERCGDMPCIASCC